MTDYTTLPEGLPVPEDDGAADHLQGAQLPPLVLPTSDGGTVDLSALGPGRTVIYLYPLTGRPGVEPARRMGRHPGSARLLDRGVRFPRPLHRSDRGRRGPRLRNVQPGRRLSSRGRPAAAAAVPDDLRYILRSRRGATAADIRRSRSRSPVRAVDFDCARRRDRARLLPDLPAERARPTGPRLATRTTVEIGSTSRPVRLDSSSECEVVSKPRSDSRSKDFDGWFDVGLACTPARRRLVAPSWHIESGFHCLK